MIRLGGIRLLRDQSNKGYLPCTRHLPSGKNLFDCLCHLPLNNKPIPLEEKREKTIENRGFVLCHKTNHVPDLLDRHWPDQLHIFLINNMANGICEGIRDIRINISRPPRSKKSHKLILNSPLIISPLTTTIPHCSNLIPIPMDDGSLMKKSSIFVPLFDPSNSRFLIPKHLLLPQERVVRKEHPIKINQALLRKNTLLVLPIL